MTRKEMIENLNGKQIYVDMWDDKYAIIDGIFYLPDGDFDLSDESIWTEFSLNKMVATGTL